MSWSGLPEIIESKIIPEPNSGCWLWIAGVRDKAEGYGGMGYAGKTWRSHKLVYTLLRGEVPEGLLLDHDCRNRICCNPDHLIPRTWKQNIHRGEGIAAKNLVKTHCKYGHEFTPENTIIWFSAKRGRMRNCRICSDRHKRAYNARQK
jgi:hypothetical protein